MKPPSFPILRPALFLAVLASLASAATGIAADGSNLLAKRATWQETMLASREAYLEWTRKEGVPLLERSVTEDTWYVTAPLTAESIDDRLFPETQADTRARDDAGASLWTERWDLADGVIHSFPGNTSSSIYLLRSLYNREKQPLRVELVLDANCESEIWLNTAKLPSSGAPRGSAADPLRLRIDLAPGRTNLLLKLHSGRGGQQFRFALLTGYPDLLWNQIGREFPTEAGWVRRDDEELWRFFEWFRSPEKVDVDRKLCFSAVDAIGRFGTEWANAKGDGLRREIDQLANEKAPSTDRRWLDLYVRACKYRDMLDCLTLVNTKSLRMAIEDLQHSFPGRYTGAAYLGRLDDLEKQATAMHDRLAEGSENVDLSGLCTLQARYLTLQRDALCANPLLDFNKLLLIQRKDPGKSLQYFNDLGLPNNWQGNCSLRRDGWDNEIAVLSPVRPEGKLTTLFRPPGDECLADVDLRWDADRMLFSMQNHADRRWQVWEIGVDGGELRQVTPDLAEADNYDACYLPDGKILFDSSAVYQGIPCVSGGDRVANLFRMDADGSNLRQLCFDQDHNWHPTVTDDGRVLYTRWEYSDTPHYFSRLLFQMNPDGTGQKAFYGSNGYWPNSIFFARPIPGRPSKFVGIVSGHHGNPRMGELVVFDAAAGRQGAAGAVQRIPGHGQPVEPVTGDGIVNRSWPKFLHPYPLSDKHFLVSCKPNPWTPWGLYLADIFDNLVLLAERPGYALLEPIPVRERELPPIVPDRIVPESNKATVYLTDVYAGPGLRGVPRGTVKSLRLFEFHYTYPGTGGHIHVGIDGPWDVHRILGTVPVYQDGSAAFTIPANTPIAVQPLDEQGQAVQVMRSWFVGMPGEVVSCAGCHESQNACPPTQGVMALSGPPTDIRPWYGPARGFDFGREVQPVLDKNCVGCHDGRPRDDGRILCNLRGDQPPGEACGNRFDAAYMALHPYVRRPGNESDYQLPNAYEYHVSTSPLIQMLRKGHYGVRLDGEAEDRLITWIDLNVPDHGTWSEHREIRQPFHDLRQAMRTRAADRPEDPEAIVKPYAPGAIPYVTPALVAELHGKPELSGWPFDAAEAQSRQRAGDLPPEINVALGSGQTLRLMLVPAGDFVMGDNDGLPDEQPAHVVKIDSPFYLGKFEITNAQYALFAPAHESGVISRYGKDHANRGEDASGPDQPVLRVSWREAMAFCGWLNTATGGAFALPTEAQWEHACRAGTATAMNYGDLDTDFGRRENLADRSLVLTGGFGSFDWVLKRTDVDDRSRVTAPVGRYLPNAWGLCDIHGNVAEWTRSDYQTYPYRTNDGRDESAAPGRKVVRGGSFYDPPDRARSSFRTAYLPHQRVWNVGFRVACDVESARTIRSAEQVAESPSPGRSPDREAAPDAWKFAGEGYTLGEATLTYEDARGAHLVTTDGRIMFGPSSAAYRPASRAFGTFADAVVEGRPVDLWFSCLMKPGRGSRDFNPWSVMPYDEGPSAQGGTLLAYVNNNSWTGGKEDRVDAPEVEVQPDHTNLIICRYQVPADRHSFIWTWYVNPRDLADPLGTSTKTIWSVSNPRGTLRGLNGFGIRNRTDADSRFEFDEIRYGKTIGDVTPHVPAAASNSASQ